jgi:putative ABC transport system permease protein
MRSIWIRVRELVRARTLDRESAEELAHHVDLQVARYVDSGMTEAGARRRARFELGSVEGVRAQLADARSGFAMEQIVREAGYAFRVLRRSPGITVVSAVTMGIGIGIGTLLFALLDGIVLRPLPYPQPDRLVRIFDTNAQTGVDRGGAASGNIDDWRTRTSSFDGIAAFYAMGRTLSTDAGAEVIIAAQVTDDFFTVLGVSALIGRTFTAEEFRRAQFNGAAAPVGADPVAVLSHRLWRQQFASDPSVIGRIVTLERRPFKVVGVMPEGFAMPNAGVQLWIPWDVSGAWPRDQHYLIAIGRLKAHVTIRQAEEHLNAVAAALGREHPDTNRGWGVRLISLRADTVGDAATILWVLLSAVALLIGVACANVALFSLTRGLDRAQETAVRLALGASAGRLVRESLLESALLAALGGMLGVALVLAAQPALPRLTANLPRLHEVALDGRALLFCCFVTTMSAVLSGLPQAWRRVRSAPAAGLSGSRTTTDSRHSHRIRDAIVVAQFAMAVVLLGGTVLLVRSFLHLRDVDPGFNAEGVLVAPVFLDSQKYTTGEHTRSYYRTLFERLSALPGVTAVGGTTKAPTSPLGPDFERPVWRDGAGTDPAGRLPASVWMVTPGYFPVLGLQITDGRAIDDRDRADATPVVMISETLARRLWPAGGAVGSRLVVDQSRAGALRYDVIGVVGDVRFRGPRSQPAPEIYLPHAQRPYLVLNVVLRTTGDPRLVMPAVRRVMKEIDPQKPAHGLYPLQDLIAATYARERQVMTAMGIFGGTAVFLAMLGVSGALSQRVRERSREIGIRIAMGADAFALVRWVSGVGLRLMVLGVACGLVIARFASGALQAVLFGVNPTDPLTVTAVGAVLIVVGLIATLIPSWRATRIDPVGILRRG